MTKPAPVSQPSSPSLATLKREMLALAEQLDHPPRPMNRDLVHRLEKAYYSTLKQIELILRRAS